MEHNDDNLVKFAEHGALPLPTGGFEDTHLSDGASIWYATYGAGFPVVLLHGGLGHSGNFGYQVPALVEAGYKVIVIDSRGHGRSTRDGRQYSYHLMAADVLGVLDTVGIDKAAFVGWSDGACTAMVLSHKNPERSAGVLFFACNMDPSGTKPLTEFPPILGRCFSRHAKDYKELSATPDDFDAFVAAVTEMQKTEPNYSVADLAEITVPVVIVQSEHDEFIKREHAMYLAENIPGAKLLELAEVSHFAPLQRPAVFNAAVLDFLGQLTPVGVLK